MSATVWILGVFVLILLLVRLKVPLTLAILAATVTAGIAFGLDIKQLLLTMGRGAVRPRTVGLALIMALVLTLSATMERTGQMEQIVLLAKKLLRRPAFAMAALPALIGFLPMPGGALLSAPMVKSAASSGETKGAALSAINYWYRHVWEHWWPLYPGVILTIALTGLPYSGFVLRQVPLGLLMILTGIFLFRGTHPQLHVKGPAADKTARRKLLVATASIWVIIVVWIPASYITGTFMRRTTSADVQLAVGKFLPLGIALISSIVLTIIVQGTTIWTVGEVVRRKNTYIMVALVVSVMVFQSTLEQVGASAQIASELLEQHVPVVIVIGALPFIAGLVTGLAIGFVGTSFPIVLALVSASGQGQPIYAYVALAYAFGHLGQMVSPIHLCHILSNQYFQTRYSEVYRRLLPSVAVNCVLVAGYFVLLKAIHG